MANQFKFNEGVYEFLDNVYKETYYDDKEDADCTFAELRVQLAPSAETSDGQKVIRFAAPQVIRATEESGLRDVIKVVWRMTKVLSGTPQHKLTLFILGVGTLCALLRGSPSAQPKSQEWIASVEKWLGVQLTIGGKGCIGEGEGSVKDRLQRFMSTPYLHDFD